MFEVIDLPYSFEDLEPHISKNTMFFHYEKHHKGYYNNLLKLSPNIQELQGDDLDMLDKFKQESIEKYQNAAQVINHNLFWTSMKKNGGRKGLSEQEIEALESCFESFDNFKEKFIEAGIKRFGSGWVWLVFNKNSEQLEIISTPNGDLPDKTYKILLVCDVWEHAYYLDYQNNRRGFLEVFLEHLADFSKINLVSL